MNKYEVFIISVLASVFFLIVLPICVWVMLSTYAGIKNTWGEEFASEPTADKQLVDGVEAYCRSHGFPAWKYIERVDGWPGALAVECEAVGTTTIQGL